MKYRKNEETVSAFQFSRESIDKAPPWFQYNDNDLFSTDGIIIGCYDGTDRVVRNNDWIILSEEKEGLFVLKEIDFDFVFELIEEDERDPWLNPWVGDIFRFGKDGRERHIIARPESQSQVVYRDVRETGDHGKIICSLDSWHKWVKKTKPKIIQRFEDI